MSTPYPRLWHTADGSTLVADGDPRAAFLAWSGHEPVPDDVLTSRGMEPASMPEPPAERQPIPMKKAPAPADKRGTRPADKTRRRAVK